MYALLAGKARKAFFLSSIAALLLLTTHRHADATAPGQWLHLPSGTSSGLSSVFGGASFASAVGANGTFLLYDGLAWNPIFTPTTQWLNAVWGASPNRIFVVGNGGTVLDFDGLSVSKMPYVTSANLRSVWARSPADAFAVGDNGTILRFDGVRWARVPSGTAMALNDVYGESMGDVLAVGNNGTILRLRGTSWSIESTPTTAAMYGVWTSAAVGFAVGNGGTILRNRGGGWELMTTPTTANLSAVWGLSDSQVFAVGDNGTLLFFDGARWSLSHLETNSRLNGIDNGFVVGLNGTVFRNATLFDEIQNLRITEVDLRSGEIEVTNSGPSFVSGSHALCHLFDCTASIPTGTEFLAGEIKVFPVPDLDIRGSDLWLYRTMPFGDRNNTVHGLQYGSMPDRGYTSVAVDGGRWPNASAVTPAPPVRATIAYDGYGFDPKDWYIDQTPTMGAPDFTPRGAIPNSISILSEEQTAAGFVLTGTEDFENVSLGDGVDILNGWQIDNSSSVRGAFTARVVGDVDGSIPQLATSARWLRIRDQDAGDTPGAVTTPVIGMTPGAISGYSWTFRIHIEETPGTGPAYPAFVMQHPRDVFEDTWGIEIHPDGVWLVVMPAGGRPGSRRLGALPVLGQPLDVAIDVDFESGLVEASIAGLGVGALPIELAGNAEAARFRFAYQGGGTGNVGTMILDDLTVKVVATNQPLILSAAAAPAGSDVHVSWTVYGEDATAFAVYRQTDDSPEERLAGSLPADARQFVDQGLPTGHTYRYVVGATKADGEEVRSHPAQVEIEALPAVTFKNLRASRSGDDISIVWDVDVNEPIAGFRMFRRSSLDDTESDLTGGVLLPPSVRHFDDADVRKGQWYSHVVVAVATDGTEIRSKQTFVAIPSPPLQIMRVFPNPFSLSTSLDFSLAETGRVRVDVYDVQGKHVATVSQRNQTEGTHSVTWDGRDDRGHTVSAGTYFFKLQTRGTVLTQKVVIVR